MKLALALPLTLLLAPLAVAGEILVPSDQPDLEAALAVAVPGDVIRVQTTADQASNNGALLVDKPLTIVGEPVINLKLTDHFKSAGFQLAGPGYGEVVFIGLKIDYLIQWELGNPSFFGGGFDGVRLYDCSIRHDNDQPNGVVNEAYPAVDLTDVDELTVVHSDLLGGLRTADICVDPLWYGNGEAGIRAPSTSVLVIDSTVRGGDGGLWWLNLEIICPGDLSTLPGKGGPGIIAAEAHAWNSTVAGGPGADIWTYTFGWCMWEDRVHCGKQADGPAYIVTGVQTTNPCSRLTQASPRVPIGGQWTVDWDATSTMCWPLGGGCPGGCPAFLFVDLNFPVDPVPFAGDWVFLNPSAAVVAGAFPSNLSKQISVAVPSLPTLAGMPVSAQVMLANGELSGPVTGLILP